MSDTLEYEDSPDHRFLHVRISRETDILLEEFRKRTGRSRSNATRFILDTWLPAEKQRALNARHHEIETEVGA